MTYGEDWIGYTEAWKIQAGISQTMHLLNTCDECGHIVPNLFPKGKGVWVGGRAGSEGRKLIVGLIGSEVVEHSRRILDRIEEN